MRWTLRNASKSFTTACFVDQTLAHKQNVVTRAAVVFRSAQQCRSFDHSVLVAGSTRCPMFVWGNLGNDAGTSQLSSRHQNYSGL
jgi:hypothetical protein